MTQRKRDEEVDYLAKAMNVKKGRAPALTDIIPEAGRSPGSDDIEEAYPSRAPGVSEIEVASPSRAPGLSEISPDVGRSPAGDNEEDDPTYDPAIAAITEDNLDGNADYYREHGMPNINEDDSANEIAAAEASPAEAVPATGTPQPTSPSLVPAKDKTDEEYEKGGHSILGKALIAAIPTLAGALLSPYSAAAGAQAGAEAGMGGLNMLNKEEAEKRKQKNMKELVSIKAGARAAGAAKPVYKTLYDPKTGTNKIFQIGPNGEQKEVGTAGYAPQVRTNKETGNYQTIFANKSGQPERTPQAQAEQQMTPVVRQELAKLDKELKSKEFQETYKKLDAAENVENLLNTRNPVTDKAAQSQMARLAGEVGVLTDQDVARFSGSKALLSRWNQALQDARDGKFTEENRTLMLQAARALKITAEKQVNDKLDRTKEAYQSYGRASDDQIEKLLSPYRRANVTEKSEVNRRDPSSYDQKFGGSVEDRLKEVQAKRAEIARKLGK